MLLINTNYQIRNKKNFLLSIIIVIVIVLISNKIPVINNIIVKEIKIQIQNTNCRKDVRKVHRSTKQKDNNTQH